MEPRPGAPSQPNQLRPLNQPEPVRMERRRAGLPRVQCGRQRLAIVSVQDEWRVEDEWWRSPVSRRYFQVTLEDGRGATLYQDLLTRQWYRQNYG